MTKGLLEKLKDLICSKKFLVLFFIIVLVIIGLEMIRKDIRQPSIIVLSKILTSLIIISIVTFVVFYFDNWWKRKGYGKRKAKSVESYIFDLGDWIFTILNCLTLFHLLGRFFGKDLDLFIIRPDKARIIEIKLDLAHKYFKNYIPIELKEEFKENSLQLDEKAKVFPYNDKWRIQAEGSPYVIKKECGKLKICRANYFFVDSWVFGNLLLTIPIFWFWSSIPDQLEWMKWIAIVWGTLRVYEPPIYGIKVVLFDPERARRKNRPARLNPYRSLILTLVGYENFEKPCNEDRKLLMRS